MLWRNFYEVRYCNSATDFHISLKIRKIPIKPDGIRGFWNAAVMYLHANLCNSPYKWRSDGEVNGETSGINNEKKAFATKQDHPAFAIRRDGADFPLSENSD